MEGIMRIAVFAVAVLFLWSPASCGDHDELELPSISAFSVGTDINIRSVKEIAVEPLNTELREARARKEEWTNSAMHIALRLSGAALSGSRQSVSVTIEPSEWEQGRTLRWVRVTIVDEGWLDDSVSGERYMVWLSPDSDGKLEIRRILWAQLCHRPYWKYYSNEPCP
jgi:hypothetical protein